MITSNKETRRSRFFTGTARSRQSAKVKYFFKSCPKTCDQFAAKGHSLYFGAGAPVEK